MASTGTDIQPPEVVIAALAHPSNVEDSDAVPTYTETDEHGLEARLAAVEAAAPPNFALPITDTPLHPLRNEWPDDDYPMILEAHKLKTAIVTAFFDAVTSRREETVRDFIARGLVSPDVTSLELETPLLAAVRAGDGTMICTLISLGAEIDRYGESPAAQPTSPTRRRRRSHRRVALRTPLQLAAYLGRLPLVKLLREDFGADDSLIADDGETALRLAAKGKHREVVEYLPLRRGGAWRRWKTSHDREVRVVKQIVSQFGYVAKGVVWDVPKAVFWTLPQDVWRRRARIWAWCIRQIREMPSRLKRGVKFLGRVWRKLPDIADCVIEAVSRFLKALPGAVWMFLCWVGRGIRAAGMALWEAFKRVGALIHTAFAAVINFFKTITLKDVVDGIKAVLRAVFVNFPLTLWSFIKNFSTVLLQCLEAAAGCFGTLAFGILWCLWMTITWIPRKIFEIIAAAGRSVGKGVEEILVWFNPKRV